MYLIVGLGNPGATYENTRHNLGFRVIEELGERLGLSHLRDKCRSFVGEGKIDDHKVIIAEPQTFMNNSGEAIRELLFWYKLNSEYLIVVHDDVDLEVGEIRIKRGGGSAGHHGLESIIKNIGDSEFIRVRIGIGRESLIGDVTPYVLSEIPPSQREAIDASIIVAADAVTAIIREGLTSAMNKFNK